MSILYIEPVQGEKGTFCITSGATTSVVPPSDRPPKRRRSWWQFIQSKDGDGLSMRPRPDERHMRHVIRTNLPKAVAFCYQSSEFVEDVLSRIKAIGATAAERIRDIQLQCALLREVIGSLRFIELNVAVSSLSPIASLTPQESSIPSTEAAAASVPLPPPSPSLSSTASGTTATARSASMRRWKCVDDKYVELGVVGTHLRLAAEKLVQSKLKSHERAMQTTVVHLLALVRQIHFYTSRVCMHLRQSERCNGVTHGPSATTELLTVDEAMERDPDADRDDGEGEDPSASDADESACQDI